MKEFLSNFNTTTPITFKNKNNFFYSTGIATTKPSSSAWVRFWIENNRSYKTTIGASPDRRFERMGMVAAQVFIPPNSGTYSGDTLCEEIIEIFEGKRFENIVCGEGYYREAGNVEEDFFTYDVTIFYTFDETK